MSDEKKFVVKDSGARQSFDTGSVRDLADGKGRFDLIPTLPMRRLAVHYENGSKKYGDRNWEKGQPLSRYLDSAERHLNCLKAGEPTEDHAIAAVWNLFSYVHTLAAIEAGTLPKDLDNRPPVDPQYQKAHLEELLKKLGSSSVKIVPAASKWNVTAWRAGKCIKCGGYRDSMLGLACLPCWDSSSPTEHAEMCEAAT